MAPTVARLKEHGIASWSVIYNKQITDSSWKKAENSATQNKAAMMAAMAKLGFVPSPPPATLKAEATYNETEDNIAQVAFANTCSWQMD